MRNALLLLGLPEMSLTSLLLFATMVVLALLMFGWLSDILLRDGAFGIAGNAILLAIGAVGGAMLWRRYGIPIAGFNPLAAAAIASLSAAILILLAATLIKRRL